MEITAAQAYGILSINDNCILSKDGSITFVFGLKMSEAYTMDASGFDDRHNHYYRAFSHIKHGYVHKQDVFLKRKFDSSTIEGSSYIQRAERDYFNGREYLQHFSFLAFTLNGLATLEKGYQSNPFAYKEGMAKADREKLGEFIDSVESAISIIRNVRNETVFSLSKGDIVEYVLRYVNGFHQDAGIRDIRFADKIQIGEKKAVVFSICDENYLPDSLSDCVPDATLGRSNKMYMAPLEQLGVFLPCQHVINQVWKFNGNAYKEELKDRVRFFGRHRAFDKEIEVQYHGLETMQNDMLNESENQLCRTSYNITVFDDTDEQLEKWTDMVKNVFNNADCRYYIPSYDALYKIFVSSVIGRVASMPEDLLYLADLHSALCLNINYTAFTSDEEGTFFNDRIYQIPIKKDLWDAGKKRIAARNGIIVASTGGGKSVTALNIVQQDIENGVKDIVVEFGKSFYQIAKLYPERSLHIDYDGREPLGINPFRVDGFPEADKIKMLVNLIFKFWRMPMLVTETPQVVSLTKILLQYYKDVQHGHSFPDFYNYVVKQGNSLFERFDIKPEYFDLDSFKHNCSEFLPGGFYENVCRESDREERIKDKDFIVFELTRIKKDPFLITVVMSILYDTIENKILSDRSVRGKLIFDEYAESQAIKDQSSGTDIHSTVAFFYQKLRKENGAIITVIQTPSQLPDNEYTKGMFANTQILYVLPASEVVYNDVVRAFQMDKESQINLMKSIGNDFAGKRPYSEIFMRFGDNYATVMRLELSPEKFLAFQTDGEAWQAIDDNYRASGNMQEAIEKYKQSKHRNYEKGIIG